MWQQEILKASKFCAGLSNKFHKNGYTVQSVRIVTNPFGEYLNTNSIKNAIIDLKFLADLLNTPELSGMRVRFAIGEAKTKNEIEILPELIKEFGDLCNVCVNIGLDEFDVPDNELVQLCAKTVKKISHITLNGEGNFNFTVNFNCKPLIPYFPASYHKSELGNRFVIGLETPDLLFNVLKNHNKINNGKNHNDLFKGYQTAMSAALTYHILQIKNIIDCAKNELPFVFSGFDSSAAPSKDCTSMVEIYKQMGVEYFGSSGTVEASSLLTNVFKSIKNVDLVGFSGFMLALTEDTGLAQGSIDNDFDIRSLLTYSAVCGIGLDTVPIPGNTSIEKISALMRDTATMAYRLDKPLTVRVFPIPGLKAGDLTAFTSADLCDCAILAVP